jgi:Tfp pilus assembly protein PilN
MDVAVVGSSGITASLRIPLDLSNEPTTWAKAVRSAGSKLKEIVTELDADGAKARVLYRSPAQSVDLHSFALRTSGQACAAAVLPLADSLPYSLTSASLEAVAIGRDAGGPDRRWHVVVAADRSDVIRAIVEMVESAGLKFDSATPIDAAIIAGVVRSALSYSGPQHGWLHFGKHSSFFVLGSSGRVRFVRSIAIGTETIVDTLTRSIRSPDEHPINLDHDTARKIFYEHGIPDNDDVLDESLQIRRRHIMPQMQPVLQRYVVELRQSLRFGLSEDERQAIEITVSGPGSTIPGLSELIAWELNLKLATDARYKDYDFRAPAGDGSELHDSLGKTQFLDRLNLQPAEAALRRQVGRLRQWLWTGAVTAVAVIALDAVQIGSKLTDARQRADALTLAATEAVGTQDTHRRLLAAGAALHELEQTIAAEAGVGINMRAILQELSSVTPPSIKLNSLRLSRKGAEVMARIHGRAIEIDKATGQTEVGLFIKALKTSALLRDASLRDVERGSFAQGNGERFEASFQIVLAPDISAIQVATGDEGELP